MLLWLSYCLWDSQRRSCKAAWEWLALAISAWSPGTSCRMRHDKGTGSSPVTGQPVTTATGNTSVLIWLLVQSIYPDNNKRLCRVCFSSENTPLSVIRSKCLGKRFPLNPSRATVANISVKHGERWAMRSSPDICLRLSKCIVYRRECDPLTWGLEPYAQLVPGTPV